MSILSITVPDEVRDAAERAVETGRFATVSEYVAALILADQSCGESAEVESFLVARARSSPSVEATGQTFDRIRERLEDEIAKRHRP
jgi:Arc/MetJ-type ribon-helix-helix transcriptional regulator